MKLFAILTAGLMTVGGGYYFSQSGSNCSRSGCGMPLPTATSGCCSGEPADCCATQDECCALQAASSAVATHVVASVETKCCAKTDKDRLVTAACCTVEKVIAVAKPIQIESCCEACVSPASAVTSAAKSIASVK
ncbi:hypothetical protein J8F10_09530 [Gemmata sp. G18]|uniref:Uncharacterized protein n=1 Tax=Gemmata palustris TaxID=2822762 RepID=A0ABS5BQD5_9BACT|nr:hypothetical protein [Gemmata palustris]MBP3955520.1 hypothetical protein [Gemmata palustris]